MKKYWKAFWMLVKLDYFVILEIEDRAWQRKEQEIYDAENAEYIRSLSYGGRQYEIGKANGKYLERNAAWPEIEQSEMGKINEQDNAKREK